MSLIEWPSNFALGGRRRWRCCCAAGACCAARRRTDRVLALDTLYINAVALVILLGMRWRTGLLFEAALIVAMLGFVSTVALARYLSRGDVIE